MAVRADANVSQSTLPDATLIFSDGCGDCARREVTLPEPLPLVGDDFDWLLRDYDGFRLFMLEELAARFPERLRWTPADMEVVLVEALAVVLDQLSDMLDRTQVEAFLETARRPDSVRRLLSMVGYDAVAMADTAAKIPEAVGFAGESQRQKHLRLAGFHSALQQFMADYPQPYDELNVTQQLNLQAFIDDSRLDDVAVLNAVQLFIDNAPEFVERARHLALIRYWGAYPHAMNEARSAGPRAIHTQKRMVTVNDYAHRLEEHPLVLQGHAFERWSGSWATLYSALIMKNNIRLDTPLSGGTIGGADLLQQLQNEVDEFNQQRDIPLPNWAEAATPRTVLRPYLDAYRMVAQEVFLLDANPVGVNLSLSVRIADNYFQSEVKREVMAVLGNGLGGFFEAGNLRFGEDLHGSDIIEIVMALDGVRVVCLHRFKRVGKRYANKADAGRIRLDGLEVAVCDNNPGKPARGILRVVLHGGRRA